jgi:TnpA family transposase
MDVVPASVRQQPKNRTHENQRHRASGLNLVVAAMVLWNTVYLEQAVAAIRQSGQAVYD